MEYEDELERMRNRRRREKARGQQHTGNTARPRQEAGREPDLIHTDFDGGAGRRSSASDRQRQRRADGYDRTPSGFPRRGESFESRQRRRNAKAYDERGRRYEEDRKTAGHGHARSSRDGYDEHDGYKDFDDYGGYDEYDGYGSYGGYDDYDDSYGDYDDGYGDYDDGYDDYDDGYDDYDSYDRDGKHGGRGDYDDEYSGRRGDYSDYDRRRGGRSPEKRGRGVKERAGGAVNQPDDRGNSGKMPRKKKRKFLLLKIFLLLAVVAGAYFVFQYRQTGTGYWTVAVFGVDSRDGNLEKGALSDVEMVCVIDRGTGDIKLVSVFRDTYLEINSDGTYHKINEAYFKGGHEQAIQALERNLDLSIDDYATFNWKAVVDAVNILGGIDLEISDSEFKYINSFITETVNSTGIGSYQLEHAGMNHLDGIQAVAYARLRLMDTDYNRTARQRLVIQLAMNKAKEADLKTLTCLVQAVLPQLSTSIGVDDLLPMARNIRKYHIAENGGFPFSRGETYIGKKDCVIPLTLESNVIQLHQLLYGTENFQPSETVKQISAKIASDSGMGEVAPNAPEARILGQRALEGSGTGDGAGNSNSANSNSTGGEGVSGNPAPPAGTQAAPAQTEMPQESPMEPMESSAKESSEESSLSGEENQEETETAVSGPGQEPGPGASLEESETGPGNPGTQPPEAGPAMTETAPKEPARAPAETPLEESSEIGPGMS